MEVFVDFGLFELLAALGVTTIAKAIYSRRSIGVAFLLASVGAPLTTLLLARGEASRWIAAGSLATALVNAVVVVGALQRGQVPIPALPRRRAGQANQGRH